MPHGPDDIYDQLLVLRCQDRDAKAFEELFKRWHPRLLRHAWRMTGNTDLASDVTQETWMNISRAINRLRDPATFPAWAYRITSRRAADAIRKIQRQRADHKHLRDNTPRPSQQNSASLHDTDDNHLQHELRALPADEQAILALHYCEGLSIRDLAHVFDIPPGTVKSRLFHARNKLRSALEKPLTIDTK